MSDANQNHKADGNTTATQTTPIAPTSEKTTAPRQATGLWAALLVCGFILSLGASWMTLKHVDFGYPFLHGFLNIDKQIKKHSPKNQYRKGFETTDAAEQKRLFHEIVIAIHGDISKLNTLTYHSPDGTAIDTLLREPEIVHLQDVQVLLNKFFLLCFTLIPITAGLIFYLRHKQIAFPGTGKIIKRFTLSLAIISAVIIFIGPTQVFYQLHIWLFPAENQWFFYYYESLMTTLMVAPVIFGPIAVFIVLAALPYTFAFVFLVKRMTRAQRERHTIPNALTASLNQKDQ